MPRSAWFAVAAGIAAAAIRVRGSSLPVHLRLIFAACALLVIGAWIERFAFRLDVDGRPPAPAHRILLGQAGLVLYFYARSAIGVGSGGPGVFPLELPLLAAAAAIHLAVRRKPRPTETKALAGHAAVWLAWWASTFVYLGYRSGRLEPPASDPDLHALWAKLTAEHGRVIYDLLPLNDARVAYPSGFSVLNAVWIDLTRLSPVEVVNCQIALQACLLVTLLLEMLWAMRRGPAIAASLALLAVAHWIFSFPVNAAMAFFEGTPRLAHKASALLPLTFAVRLAFGQQGRNARGAVLVIGAFSLAWAFAVNPSLVLVELPILVATGLIALRGGEARSDRGMRLHAMAALLASLLAVALVTSMDAWLRAEFGRASEAPVGSRALSILHWAAAILAGLRTASDISVLWALPVRCTPSAQCVPLVASAGPWLASPALVFALVVLAMRSRTPAAGKLAAAARVVVAIAVALWMTAFLAGFAPALAADAPGLEGSLLQSYSRNALVFSTAVLFYALLCASAALAGEAIQELASSRGARAASWGDLAAAAALLCVVGVAGAIRPEQARQVAIAYVHDVRGAPRTALGPIEAEDVRLARAAGAVVASGEKILLPGVAKEMNRWEVWFFALGGARAVPLYGHVPFAFFHAGAGDRGIPYDYRDHVCDRFDLPWLADRGIVWVYESRSVESWACLHSWSQVRNRYFERRLHDGSASLWRLRGELLPQALHDPILGLRP
ncbi:MAG: hypothetical protein ACJ79H_19820 [Myxococcales bacterium]